MRNLYEEDIRPQLVGHVYWNEKAVFQLKEDTNEYWVLFAVEDGCFTFEINDRKGRAAFSDLVLCPPGVVFRREVIQPLSFHFILLEWVNPTGLTVFPQADVVPYGKITIKDIDRLSSNYTHFKKRVGTSEKESRKYKNHLLADLWYLYCEETDATLHSSIEGAAKDVLIVKALHEIQEQAFSTISLKKIAEALGLTQVQFTRRFKKMSGMLPIDFLTSLRLQKVQKLLLESTLTLQEIAGRCGYENEYYLSRIFTKRIKITPSQFRKLHRL